MHFASFDTFTFFNTDYFDAFAQVMTNVMLSDLTLHPGHLEVNPRRIDLHPPYFPINRDMIFKFTG